MLDGLIDTPMSFEDLFDVVMGRDHQIGLAA
jgi:hypothetical protein